ncbi:hypothetical protein ABE504_09805 [Paenibacillus oryzisoli]|uniref:hypothetical protein n=1 Tax=Paenibacillus oryzisoli TaxID=1850517 RepID=UPI003D2A52B1
MSWKQALKTFCDLYSESKLTNKWIIVGSVGSVLQNAKMEPNDLDIYVQNIEDVQDIAELLGKFNLKSKSDLSYSDGDWLSSNE